MRQCAYRRRRRRGIDPTLAQIVSGQLDEAAQLGQARHRHIQALAVPQRTQAHRNLGSIRVALDHLCRSPDRQRREPLGCRLGADEARDMPEWLDRRDALLLEQRPDLVSQRIFAAIPPNPLGLAAIAHRWFPL